jgi:hypothetical protein
MAPYVDPATGSSAILARDKVRVTLYGLQNDEVQAFMNCVNQYSLYSENFGICNLPIPRDAKRTQEELLTIAMKKTIEYEISYNQTSVRALAQKLIETVVVQVFTDQTYPNPITP